MRALASLSSAGAGHEQALRRLEAENFRLREALDTAREELIQLKEKAARDAAQGLFRSWGIKAPETKILLCLLQRDQCSKQYLLDELYWDRDYRPDSNIITVFISNLRKNIGKRGMVITTIWGWLLENRRAWLKQLMEA